MGRRMQPVTLCAYEVDIEPVFDSLNTTQRVAFQVDDHELVCGAWEAEMLDGNLPASQALADRLISAGCVGMLVRSFAVGAGNEEINLVLWKWRSERPCRVILIDDECRLANSSR